MNVQQALIYGKNFLSSKENSSLDSRLLLAYVFGVNTSKLISMYNESLEIAQYQAYINLLKRRNSGICVAYLVGKKEFYGYDFIVSPEVLVPRPETELLVESALLHINSDNTVLDMGTGSGAIAITLKKERPLAHVYAADISSSALNIARLNAKSLDVPVNYIESDLFEHIDRRFDCIVANLPYIDSHALLTLSPEVLHEPRCAIDGGENGLMIINRFIEEAHKHLNAQASLLLEASPDQITFIQERLLSMGYTHVQCFKDLAGMNRVIYSLWQEHKYELPFDLTEPAP
ncbi:MAG: peptide chain release factor N(5)-glutamine methyltransferase [Treponema sp.]|jgi:release factor glutamine methyltransferase|nr:peptide chain release factor N(5)-glutamine methyltransferase [Treponema sp.]